MFIMVMSPQGTRPSQMPTMRHRFPANNLATVKQHGKTGVTNSVLQRGLAAAAHWPQNHFINANHFNPRHTPLRTRKQDPPFSGSCRHSRATGETSSTSENHLPEHWEHVPTQCNNHKTDSRQPQQETASSSVWGANRDMLQALYIAQTRSQAIYRIETWR